MKKLILVFTLFLSCFSALVAENGSSSDSSNGDKIIKLKPIDKPGKMQRMPAMPIYGFYSGDVLRFDIYSEALDEIYVLRIYDVEGGISCEGYYSVGNLIEGVIIYLPADSSVELVTSSGKTYSEI